MIASPTRAPASSLSVVDFCFLVLPISADVPSEHFPVNANHIGPVPSLLPQLASLLF